MPIINLNFDPEFYKICTEVAARLHFIAENCRTREQAIAVKEMMARPLGVLNSRHALVSNSPHRRKNRGSK